jgi:hypothetical protein
MTEEESLLELQEHDSFVTISELVYKHGVKNVLLRLSDYVEDNKEAYAIYMLANEYEERESEFCKDAPTMS